MALTQISTAGVKDDAVTSGKIPANAVGTSEIADDAVTTDKLANSINTEIAANTAKTTNATHTGEVTGGTALTIADDVVDEANLKVSNSPTNGYFLSAQSGNTGGLTWAEASGTTINNNADNRVITGSGTANTLNGESLFVYDTSENAVGIGTSSPTPTASYYQGACLHIHQAASGGSVGSQLHLTTDNTGSADGDGSQISAYSSSLYINNQENGDTYFYNNGSSNLTIKANGNVGVGTQSPSDKLHVNGTATIGSNLYLSNNTYIAASKGIYFDGGTGSANHLDEYEEGTFSFTVASGGFSSVSGTGTYTKIGRVVNFQGDFTLNGSGNSDVLKLDGLPFAANSWVSCSGYTQVYNNEGSQQASFAVRGNTNDISVVEFGSEMAGNGFNAGYMNVAGCYQT